jgi:glycosyltransferase involved in cell wall biosynthesis
VPRDPALDDPALNDPALNDPALDDIVLIGPYPTPGQRHEGSSGVASYTANLAHALVANGAHVTVVAAREEGAVDDHVDGPVLVRRAFDRGPRALPTAAVAAANLDPDVVHVQLELFLYGGPSALLGAAPALASLRRRGLGPVVTLHQVVDPDHVDRDYTRLHGVAAPPLAARAGVRALQTSIGRLATTIVHEPAFTGLVPGAVAVPHGVEEAAAVAVDPAAARRRLGLGDRLTVLCFGFVAPYKGIDVALEAADRLGGEIDVVVAGGEHPRLTTGYARQLEAEWGHRARFTGWVPDEDVHHWFAAADVAFFGYRRPFAASGALALALAHRRPVLLSTELARCVGAPDELAVPADPDAVAARLHTLAADPAAVAELAAWSAALAEGRGWTEVGARHLDVYATAGRRSPLAAAS